MMHFAISHLLLVHVKIHFSFWLAHFSLANVKVAENPSHHMLRCYSVCSCNSMGKHMKIKEN